MSISRTEVVHLARLARLHLSESEIEALSAELERVLAFAGELSRVSVEGVEAWGGEERENRLRDDDPRPGLDPETALREAPEAQDGFFRVPPVLGG